MALKKSSRKYMLRDLARTAIYTQVFAFSMSGCLSWASEATRTWSNVDGSYAFRASLAGSYGNILDLRREDGLVLRIPVEFLSEADRAFAASKDDGYFEIENVGRIMSPRGYTWSVAKQQELAEGPVAVYLCHCPELSGRMTMTLSPQVAKGDGVRSSHLKGHWNGLLDIAKSANIQVFRTSQPKVEGSIADRVEYQLTGLNADKQALLLRGVTVFTKNRTILFQIFEQDNSPEPSKYYDISGTLVLSEPLN